MESQEDGSSLGPIKDTTYKELQEEIVQVKKALSRAEQRIELILKATNDAIYEWDLLTDHLSWNEGFLILIGYDSESIEHTLDFWSDRLHPVDRDRVKHSLNKALMQGEQHWIEEYRFQRKDGSFAYVLDRGYIVLDEQKKPIRMVGAMQDISAIKESAIEIEALSSEYAFLLHQIPSLVFRTTPEGKADFVNSRWQQYTGLQEEELLGHGWVKALHPQDIASTLLEQQEALSNGELYQTEYRLLKHDGTYHWFKAHALPYKDKEGNILKWFGTCTDIEEVKRTQYALQQSMELIERAKAEAEGQKDYFYSLLLAIPSPIAIVRGADRTVEFFNPQFKGLLGDCLQLNMSLKKCPESLLVEEFFEVLEQVYQTGETRLISEMPIYLPGTNSKEKPDGYHNLLFQAIRNKTEAIDGIMIFGHDVTQQVNARKKVEENRARVESILEGIPAIAWTSDADGKNSYFNSRWYSYCGIPPYTYVDTLEFIHPDDRETVSTSWQHAFLAIQPWEKEYRLKKWDGSYRWHLGRTIPVFDGQGNLLEWFGVGSDIEEQKQTQQKLEKALGELNEKNFELDQFVYKTSHDLRAPLTSILGLVSIIKTEIDEAFRMQYVDLIENRVEKLDTFIQSMLAYSRNTRTEVKVEEISFSRLLEECLSELSNQKHADRLKIRLHLAGVPFYSDLFRLKIMFSNIISNAIKYQDFAKEESYLMITIEVIPQRASIVFADNGVGIPKNYQAKIFDMFFRATEQAEGSGLGLYIVRQAIAVLEGEITLESDHGKGTSFKIVLPNRSIS